MYRKVVQMSGIYNLNHLRKRADPMLSPALRYSPDCIRLMGFADKTYPEITKKTDTAKCPPVKKVRTPWNAAK